MRHPDALIEWVKWQNRRYITGECSVEHLEESLAFAFFEATPAELIRFDERRRATCSSARKLSRAVGAGA